MFSILRMARQFAEHGHGATGSEWAEADALARAAASRGNDARVPRGFYVPANALDPIDARGLTTGVFDEGGAGVAATLHPGELIAALRPRRWSQAAGVREIDGLEGSGSVVLPRHGGLSTVGWLNRDGDPAPETQEVTSAIAVTPRTVGGWVDLSRGFLLQTSFAAEGWVRDQLRMSLDDAIDRAILAGTGQEGEPQGIDATPGIQSVAFETAGEPTRDELAELHGAVAAANPANPQATVFVGGSTVGTGLRRQNLNLGDRFALEHAGGFGDQVTGLAPWLETNFAPAGAVYCADFSTVVVGRWADPYDVIFNPYTRADGGWLRVHCFATADVAFGQRAVIGRGA